MTKKIIYSIILIHTRIIIFYKDKEKDMNKIYGISIIIGAFIGYSLRLVNEIYLASNSDFFVFLEVLNKVLS